MNAVKWIISNSKKSIFPVLLLCFVSALSSLCLVGLTLTSKTLIDIATKAIVGNFYAVILRLLFYIILQLVLQILYSRLNIKISGKMEMNFKTKVFNSLLDKELRGIYKYHSGELLNRLTSDVNVVVTGFINILPEIVAFGTRLIGAFVVLFFLDSSFALLYLIFGPLFFILTSLYRKKMKNLHKKCQESDGKVKSHIQEALQNILVIKAFRNEKAVSKEIDELQYINYSYKLKRNLISIVASITMYLSFTFGYYLALAWGAYKLSNNLISVGTLTAMLQLVSQIQNPLKQISGIVPQYYSAVASAERLMELLNLQNDIANSGELVYNDVYDEILEISIENLSFYYEEEVKVIENFSYSIKKGEFVAISGISGIGKSTLLKLLLGVIEPVSGEINFVLKNGNKIPVNGATRSLFSYVPQGNMILSGTIRDNIKFFKEDIKEEDILRACKIAQIDEFLKTLPDGLDTIIGEKGLGLSEGQTQRLAIARAIISNSPILLLDEATSALDEKTEIDFLNNVKEMKNKTCIIVSHKKAALSMCDKVLEL